MVQQLVPINHDFPFYNDSMATLQKKLGDYRKRRDSLIKEEENVRVRMGYILLVVAHKHFQMPECPNRPPSYDNSPEWKAFKDWCMLHSGLSWKVCRNYMVFARRPDVFARQQEYQRVASQHVQEESQTYRAMAGGRGLPKDQQRRNFAVNSLNILGDLAEIAEVVRLCLVQRADFDEELASLLLQDAVKKAAEARSIQAAA